jgi:hypothetical protein
MVDHGSRDHAQWSASSTERNWSCAGALALTDGLPEKTSEAADWGTACHQIGEKCLREGLDPTDFVGKTEKGKVHEFEVDEEMADTALVYVDYVRKAVIAAAPPKVNPASLLQIEQKFSLADLKPPFEAGGTADAVVYSPLDEELEVIDLKGGRGHVVEVVGNPQLRTYALGAMLANPGLKVKSIKVTIVQPRAPHKSGRIRSETFHVADLVEWTADLLRAMHRARKAMLDRPTMHSVVWAQKYLAAGDHCKFCKAAGFCPALERKAHDTAGVWFDDLDQPRLANSPDMLSPERAAQLLDAADMIGEYINAVRAYWHAQAEMGVEIPNYVLVDKVGRRKWKYDEAEIAGQLDHMGFPPSEHYVRKLVSPAQAEKLIGAKRKAELADLIETPVNGTNLVRADKTTRKAATASVHKHFSVLD